MLSIFNFYIYDISTYRISIAYLTDEYLIIINYNYNYHYIYHINIPCGVQEKNDWSRRKLVTSLGQKEKEVHVPRT